MTSHRIIPETELPQLIPAAYADKPADHVSENYQFVRTADILAKLFSEGWKVISAIQQKTRIAGKEYHTKHKLILRPSMDVTNLALGGLFPTINLINSGDWSSRLELLFGLMRLICTNGMIASGAEFQSYTVRHDAIHEDFNTVMARFVSSSTNMLETAQGWNGIMLEDEQVAEFGAKAAVLRFGENATPDHAKALLVPRRSMDQGNSLWNVFNRVQENAMKGGHKSGAMKRRIRKLTNIDKDKDLNTSMFELASSLAN